MMHVHVFYLHPETIKVAVTTYLTEKLPSYELSASKIVTEVTIYASFMISVPDVKIKRFCAQNYGQLDVR